MIFAKVALWSVTPLRSRPMSCSVHMSGSRAGACWNRQPHRWSSSTATYKRKHTQQQNKAPIGCFSPRGIGLFPQAILALFGSPFTRLDRPPFGKHLGGLYDDAEQAFHVGKCRHVDRAIGGGRAVIDEDDVVVLHEAVARRAFDAIVARDPGHDEGGNSLASQNEVEVGFDETAVAVLGDDHFARLRGYVIEVCAPRAGLTPSRLIG